MPEATLQILYEDNHLLAINKPAGLPTMGVAAGESSALAMARDYIRRRYHKPGNVYLGVVSRLDAAATGVLLLARTSKAARRLTEQFRSRKVQKIYWAIASGRVEPREGEWIDRVSKDESRQRMVIARASEPSAKEARLSYRCLRAVVGGTLVEIDLETGRKHQIRLQFATRGFPLLGERKYANGAPFVGGIALHARRLVIEHPVRHQTLEIIAPLPATWRKLGIDDSG